MISNWNDAIIKFNETVYNDIYDLIDIFKEMCDNDIISIITYQNFYFLLIKNEDEWKLIKDNEVKIEGKKIKLHYKYLKIDKCGKEKKVKKFIYLYNLFKSSPFIKKILIYNSIIFTPTFGESLSNNKILNLCKIPKNNILNDIDKESIKPLCDYMRSNFDNFELFLLLLKSIILNIHFEYVLIIYNELGVKNEVIEYLIKLLIGKFNSKLVKGINFINYNQNSMINKRLLYIYNINFNVFERVLDQINNNINEKSKYFNLDVNFIISCDIETAFYFKHIDRKKYKLIKENKNDYDFIKDINEDVITNFYNYIIEYETDTDTCVGQKNNVLEFMLYFEENISALKKTFKKHFKMINSNTISISFYYYNKIYNNWCVKKKYKILPYKNFIKVFENKYSDPIIFTILNNKDE